VHAVEDATDKNSPSSDESSWGLSVWRALPILWRFSPVAKQERESDEGNFLKRTTRAWSCMPNFIEIDKAVLPPGQVEDFSDKHR